MFTGIIETTGILLSKRNTDTGAFLKFNAQFENDDVKHGDSVAINGTCLTVIERDKDSFEFYASFKTLELTNLGNLKNSEKVNLERSLLPTTRLGGHIVQGHVDGIGKVISRETQDDGRVEVFKIEIPSDLSKYIVNKGSIAVDGISLTVVSISKTLLELVLIPETILKTNVTNWTKDTIVNIETDILARYIEKQNIKLTG